MLIKYRIKDESGMALVTCLLIMVVLTMIGIGITMDSTTEIKIASNLKNKAVSFQNADTGTTAAPEIIEDNLDHSRSSAPYAYSDNGANPVINVHTASFADLAEGTPLDPAITITGSDITNDVNLPINAVITVTATPSRWQPAMRASVKVLLPEGFMFISVVKARIIKAEPSAIPKFTIVMFHVRE